MGAVGPAVSRTFLRDRGFSTEKKAESFQNWVPTQQAFTRDSCWESSSFKPSPSNGSSFTSLYSLYFFFALLSPSFPTSPIVSSALIGSSVSNLLFSL